MSEQTNAPVLRIGGYEVKRDVLTEMDAELKRYRSITDRLDLLQKWIPEIPHESAPPSDGMPRGSTTGNSTMSKALLIYASEVEIRRLRAWVDAVDSVRRRLSKEHRRVADYFYFAPEGTGDFSTKQLARSLAIHRSRVYQLKDEALVEFALVLKGDTIHADEAV